MGSVTDRPIVYRRSRPWIIRSWIGAAMSWAIGLTLVVVLLAVVVLLTGRARVVPILSGSMEPALPHDGLVIVTPVAVSSVRPGDVILYSIPIGDRHVEAHRVLRVVSAGDRPVVVTKGDANASADPWEARLDGPTVWKARVVVPGIGRAIVLLRRPVTRALMLAAAVLLVLAAGLRWVWVGSAPEGIVHGAAPR